MKKIYAVAVLLVFLGAAVFLSISNFLNIKNTPVNILGADCLTKVDVENEISKENQKIFLFKDDNFVKNLKKDFSCISSVEVSKKYPDSLSVVIFGKKAVLKLDNFVTDFTGIDPQLSEQELEATSSSQSAVLSLPLIDDILKTATSSGKFLVDKTGLIFSEGDSQKRIQTFIYLGNKLLIGQNLDVDLLSNTIGLVEKIKSLPLEILGTPIIYGNTLEIKGNNPAEVILGLDNDISKQLASLQLILQAGKMNSTTKMDSVDLRFNKPVVIYSTNK